MRIFCFILAVLGMAQVPLCAQVPVITNQPTNRFVWAGVNVAFSTGVSGPGPFSYQWQFNTANLPNGVITTVAGETDGDGGPATNADFLTPLGVATDGFGNLFISDAGNGRVRKVDTNGIITTIAGTGSSGVVGGCNRQCRTHSAGVQIFKVDTNGIVTLVAGDGFAPDSGDGGAATNAGFYNPIGLALDAAGDVYIADAGDNRIRKVDTNGIVTTVAGNGLGTYSGDNGAATNACLKQSDRRDT